MKTAEKKNTIVENIQQKNKINELIDKVDELENRIEKLENRNGKMKSKKERKKVAKIKANKIKAPWEKEGLSKEEWLENKHN